MIVKPIDFTAKSLLAAGFYKIPRFQRPYSWDKENVDDFWSDAIANDDPDYFIGSFVLYREQGQSDIFMVVDGQQRLTTMTLLLASLRNAFDGIGEKASASGIQQLIERHDIDNKKRYVLLTETSYPYLQEHIQKHGAPELPKGAGREEEALEQAFIYLTQKVRDVLEAVDVDASVSKAKKNAAKKKKLVALRNNILRLQLIVVELQTEDEAYLIFETLNTRGKDLGIADLVKNLITRLMKPKNKGVDVAKDKWNHIRETFEASAADIDINAFIYHSWLSRRPYIGKEKLFRVLRGEVLKANVAAFLDSLVSDAPLYRSILEPSSRAWTKQESEVADSLEALTVFRVVQPVPMLLTILRCFDSKQLNLRQLRKILRAMEDFHVQFTAVTAQRTGGGTARMYAFAAEELAKAMSNDTRAKALANFRLKMKERVPIRGEFEANFGEIEFFSGNTKDKALVQYLLKRLDASQRKGAPVDYDKMTIEHIASENPKGAKHALSPNMVGKIGNLILVDAKLNNEDLGNKTFAEKRTLLKNAGVPLDPTLTKAKVWTDKEIEARTKWLADRAYASVFAL